MSVWINLPVDHIKPYLEVRERFERRMDRDFSISNSDNRSDLFSRLRVGANIIISKDWNGNIQFQFAHDAVWTVPKNFATENRDVALAYVEGKVQGHTLAIGRQKINVGDQRLIGALEWSNVSRSFEGIRMRTKELDVWAVKMGMNAPVLPDLRLAGATLKSRLGETSAIYKHDRIPTGDVDIWTLDHNAKRSFKGYDLEFEGALQEGKSAGLNHSAWALHAVVSKKLPNNVSAFVEANAASGGSNTTNSRTFDNLYPTNHGKYGFADMQGWKNMNEIAVGLNWKSRPTFTVHGSWHAFSLQDAKDAWYGAGGSANKGKNGFYKDPTGLSGKNIGDELDLIVTWTASKFHTFQGGVLLFEPGNFIKSMNPADSRRQVWGYVQLTTKF